jgi:hypothetical protein
MRLAALFRNYQLSGSSIIVKSDVAFQMAQVQTGLVTPTYGVAVVIDCSLGTDFIITVSNGVAFAVNAPTNVPASGFTKDITVTIANSSGGAHGAITWTAGAGGFRLAGALAAIATLNQRSIIFRWNGLVWNEIARTAADCLTA